jgi:CheY-like chemotaxis protein
MSILYVDDDLEDTEIFQDAVRTVDPSIQYIVAHSGKIVLDINMPGMDGRSCLQEIRKYDKFKGVNIVVYSTNSFPKDIEQIRSLGATFIRKANSFNDLCNMIRNLVKIKK